MSEPDLAPLATSAAPLTEVEFAERVDTWSLAPGRHSSLTLQLREEGDVYAERSSAAVVRMRGWILVGLARMGVDDADLPFILEELESGIEPYLVAAAAGALRSYREPVADFVPFLLRAFANIRARDEPLSFESYGEYAVADTGATAIGELVRTLDWLAPVAADFSPEIESLARDAVLRRYRRDVERIARVVRRRSLPGRPRPSCCGSSKPWGVSIKWGLTARRDIRALDGVAFEDHSGAAASTDELFRGRPTIVAFFYTRCDNPLKCSCTISKLGRVQRLLEERGLADEIQTTAITYDPQFDHPQRMASYGVDRGLRLDDRHRMLRATGDFDALRRHFSLGIGTVGSLINRHRLEIFILDRDGNTAAQFSRLQWDEQRVVDRAVEILREEPPLEGMPSNRWSGSGLHAAPRVIGVVGSIGAAFFPKCPVCCGAYLSLFGLASLGRSHRRLGS